jgi:(2R)-sulfolactate sulfo-lyase subunit beta
MSKFARSFVFVVAALSLVLAACGAPATAAPTTAPEPTEVMVEPTVAPTEDAMAMYAPDAVTGDVITAGSSTVFPLSERMAELFQDEGYTGNITVDSIGSGAGFERFCTTGETDIANASRAAYKMVKHASKLRKTKAPLTELWVSTKCGESDTTSGLASCPTVGNSFDKLWANGNTLVFGETTELTGGEHLVAARCKTPEIRAQFQAMFDRYQGVIEAHKTSDLSDSQPTKGNIEGGLTTIEEKALGNITKMGKKCTVDGVLDKAEEPTGPGLWFMDSSSAAAEMVTLCAASGYVVHFFPTGQGNVIGNPILPVIKLCANPRTVRTMSEHVDVDVTGLLQREITLDQAGDKLLDMMFRTANGRLTAAEALGHREFVLTRLYESA